MNTVDLLLVALCLTLSTASWLLAPPDDEDEG